MSMAHRARIWLHRAATCGALLAAAALAVPAQSAHAAPGEPSPAPSASSGASGGSGGGRSAEKKYRDMPLDELLEELQKLYHSAEESTEKYNDASDRLKKQRAEVKKVRGRLDDKRDEVDEGRKVAGALARQQYRHGSISPYAGMLLSDDPNSVIDQRRLIAQGVDAQVHTVERLEAAEKELSRLADRAQEALEKAEELAAKERGARDEVKKKLADVERVVASLTGTQLADLQRMEQREIDRMQAEFIASGALGTGARGASRGGAKAIAYALAQLGKPYVWGAEGPDSFDCSGLTSQAWLAAGKVIPRTSQEQWRQLPRVPLERMRPGDLVIYGAGATHVGIYLGDGAVVHAPRPGSYVKVAPVGSMTVIGAVRPDEGAKSMEDYKVPVVPRCAPLCRYCRKPAR